MSLSAIIAQCVTQAETVSGIGVVHDHEVFVNTRAGLEANFMAAGVINCVEIDRARTPAQRFSNFRTERQHTLHFHFYYGASESTDTRATFRALVEATEAVFRNDYTLSGVATLAGPFTIEFDGYIEKGGALLHYAQAVFVVREDVS